jgi:hypothetical protein
MPGSGTRERVECGDHYARAMASHGVFLAAWWLCITGPRTPGLRAATPPDDFRAVHGGRRMGTFAQKREDRTFRATVELKWGRLRLRTLALTGPGTRVEATIAGRKIPAEIDSQGDRADPVPERGGGELRRNAGREPALRDDRTTETRTSPGDPRACRFIVRCRRWRPAPLAKGAFAHPAVAMSTRSLLGTLRAWPRRGSRFGQHRAGHLQLPLGGNPAFVHDRLFR